MKTFRFIILLALSSFMAISCSEEYDDSELWDKVNSLDDRITSIEEQIESMNKNIGNLEEIVDALKNRLYITKVSDLSDGYVITFSDGSQIEITDGKDGTNGKDAPVIGVRLYNGKYYWTQTINGKTDWLYDNDGNIIPASGMDAATPLLKVDSDGYWIISYDNGNSYTAVRDENGNKVKAAGEDGNIFFESVNIVGDELWITLKDGSEIMLPIGKQCLIKRLI